MAKTDLTAARLRELLDYNPDTGDFIRKFAVANTKAGAVAGCTRHDGYVLVRVDDSLYLAHRLAWLYVYGELPKKALTHIDGSKSNNRIKNIREGYKPRPTSIRIDKDSGSLTHEALKDAVDYDAETGVFRSRGDNTRSGQPIGYSYGEGYLRVSILGHFYRAHRLAWFYVYGEFPRGQIDHINGVRDDNRICNLRDVTASENAMNRHFPQGVVKRGDKWGAKINVGNGKQTWLGTFNTYELARGAYLTAKRIHHTTCTI